MAEGLMLAERSAEDRAEFFSALALRHCIRLGARRACRIVSDLGSAQAAYQHIKDGGRGYRIEENSLRYLRNGGWRSDAEKEWTAASHCRGRLILWTDTEYPDLLRELPDAPLYLYARGDVSLLANHGVGMVGTRCATEEGLRAARALASGLAASGVTVISGMAKGIDTAAHMAAISLIGSTIAVLGTGIDVSYPQENSRLYQAIWEQGLLLSEFAPGSRAIPSQFPIRNRIISGLSLGVVVVEAMPGSGSLITARNAAEQNRTVYAVGGGIGDKAFSGCQELIRQGALSVFSAEDILCDLREGLHSQQPGRELCLAGKSKRTPVAVENEQIRDKDVDRGVMKTKSDASLMAEDEDAGTSGDGCATLAACDPAADVRCRLLTHLAGRSDTPDGMCLCLGLSAQDVMTTLMMLEIDGIVVRHDDGTFSLV